MFAYLVFLWVCDIFMDYLGTRGYHLKCDDDDDEAEERGDLVFVFL